MLDHSLTVQAHSHSTKVDRWQASLEKPGMMNWEVGLMSEVFYMLARWIMTFSSSVIMSERFSSWKNKINPTFISKFAANIAVNLTQWDLPWLHPTIHPLLCVPFIIRTLRCVCSSTYKDFWSPFQRGQENLEGNQLYTKLKSLRWNGKKKKTLDPVWSYDAQNLTSWLCFA